MITDADIKTMWDEIGSSNLADIILFARAIEKTAHRDMRHACAEAISGMEGRSHTFGDNLCIRQGEAHQVVMNVNL